MEGITILVDGITMQHCGELLFDSALTVSNRTTNHEVYERSLEDLTFALVYGSQVSVSGSVPEIGPEGHREAPGKVLIKELGNRFIAVEGKDVMRPEDYIKAGIVRIELEKDIGCVDNAIYQSQEFWRAWITREVPINLGDDDSLKDENISPKQLRYDKSLEYIYDPDLQRGISEETINTLLGWISSDPRTKNKSSLALREFVCRNLVTHLAINRWYEYAATTGQWPAGFRLPYGTRSAIFRLRSEKEIEPIQATIDDLSRFTLYDAIKHKDKPYRGDIIGRLAGFRTLKYYRRLREHIQKLMSIILEEPNQKGREAACGKIVQAVRKLIRQAQPEKMILFRFHAGVSFGSGPELGISAEKEVSPEEFSPVGRAIRSLRREVVFEKTDYHKILHRIFTEFPSP